jgi:hypothetical protein
MMSLLPCVQWPNTDTRISYISHSDTANTIADFLKLIAVYSVLLRTLGSTNQQASITPYMPTQTGCSTQVPEACARIPVVKGATAPPEEPAPPTKPIAVV